MGTLRLALLAVFCTACSGPAQPCFGVASKIIDPNVIGVASNPPEVVYDLTGAQPIEPVDISALVVSAATGFYGEFGRILRVTDLPTQIYVCLEPSINEVDAQPGCPAGSTLIADLPGVPSETAPFSYAPPPALLEQALAADPVHGLAGIFLRLELDIQASPTSVLRASKTLPYLLSSSPATLNHSLTITGMEGSYQGMHTTYALTTAVDMVVNHDTGLRPLIAPGPGGDAAVETYLAYDNTGTLVSLLEHVTYGFYGGGALFFGQAQGAGLAIYTGAPGDEADEPAPGSPDPIDGLVSVEPVYPGNQGGMFFVVARDDRGAVTWQVFNFYAKELRPQCTDFMQLTNPPGPLDIYNRCAVKLFGCN